MCSDPACTEGHGPGELRDTMAKFYPHLLHSWRTPFGSWLTVDANRISLERLRQLLVKAFLETSNTKT